MASESELIAALAAVFKHSDANVLIGIGDDGAVVAPSSRKSVLAADMAIEGVHFNREWSTLGEIGAKITAANLADIYAMGGNPQYLVAAVTLTGDETLEWISDLAHGIAHEAQSCGAVVVGGDLKAGAYQFAIQYCNASGDAYTSYYSITNPVSIANTEITTPDFQYSVGKSIVISINNIDITGYFQYFNIAIIKTINGGTSVELMGTYNIQDKDRTITYTGQALTNIPLSLADILEKFPYYEIAQDLTNVQDVIVWDNLTSIDRINYQSIASQIQLQWETYKLPANNTYADGFYTANLRGYLRDEVYAFEIVFLLDNGKQTDGFHIPGRTAISTDLTPVYDTNADFIGEGPVAPYWKIYNTGSVLVTYPVPVGDAGKIGEAYAYQSGDFSYWESTDTYPCNVDVWGELAGEPIRHHKFPDVLVSPYFETPPITYVGGQIEPVMQASNAIYPIGVKIDVQQVGFLIQSSSLTDAEKDAIVGFKIVRGNRSTNKSIIAKGILRNVGKYKREETE